MIATESELIVHPATSGEMRALVYRSLGKPRWETCPRPALKHPGDAIVRITTSTICGTDLHILKGDVPSVALGRILGHEGIGIIEEAGTGVSNFQKGDKVLISCITSCGHCDFCRRQMSSHCRHGGWILGNKIDGTQAEYVRIPYADNSLYLLAPDADEEAMVMLSDILPTGYECGVLNGQVRPGDTVAIVGAGPVGLAAIMTARLYSPAAIIAVDIDDHRLDCARTFGATALVRSGADASAVGRAVEQVLRLTCSEGVDVAIEAVGTPSAFAICEGIIGVGGRLANIGVHGKHVDLHMERLWDRNISLTTRLVDTSSTGLLLKMIQSGQLQPGRLATHRFELRQVIKAYAAFVNAAKHSALKVILKAA